MATVSGSLKELESWLPAEFVTMEKERFNKNKDMSEFKNPGFTFPTEFPYEFDSFGYSSASLTSPDGSVVGSTETESSDEDDFLTGLTRRLTQQLTVKPEKWVVAGSPESTLSVNGSWSVSSNGSPNGVLSPPTTPFGVKNDTWDLIYAAAGQVARLKMSNEGTKCNTYQERDVFGSVRFQNQDYELKNQNTTGLYSGHSQRSIPSASQMNQYHSHARDEHMLKQQCSSVWAREQQVKVGYQAHLQSRYHHQQIQSRGISVGCENGVRCVRPSSLTQASLPPLQVQSNHHHHLHNHHHHHHHSDSGMKAVYLGGSSNVNKKECAGTGVFLPRRYGSNNNSNNNPSEPKKKSACSPVLLPAKVVQALNLNINNLNGHAQPRLNTGFPCDYDLLMARRNAILAQQKRHIRPEAVGLNHEVRLPQEWTY